MNFTKYFVHLSRVAAISLLFCGLNLVGQPSGGPYGPIQQNYEIPSDAKIVYFVSPDGSADADGLSLESPTTIESAMMQVSTGDAIILRGGVYRTGDLVFNQGITIQPYLGEQPILKGTKIAADWETLPGGIWRTKWETLFPLAPQSWWRRERHVRDTPVFMFNNDMVFIDGVFLKTKGYPAELDESSYCVDYEQGYIYIGTDPTNRVVEISAYDNALTRKIDEVHGKTSDKIGPKIRGIVFTQYAYRAIEIEGYNPEEVSPEENHGKDVVGTILEHCTLSYCSRVGAYLRGNHMIIRNNLVSDTGTEGLFILSSNDVLLEKNIITRNNEEAIEGYFATAVKIFNQCYRVTVNDNLVIDNNHSSGIWYDVGNVDGVFTNNWLQNTTDGFFFEISKGVICAGNVFVNCVTGSRILNSSGAKVYQNTYINSGAAFQRTARSAVGDHFDWHPASGPDVDERQGHEFVNNLVVGHKDFKFALLMVWQTADLTDRLTEPMFDSVNNNVYIHTGTSRYSEKEKGSIRYMKRYFPNDYFQGHPVISWSPFDNEISHKLFDSLEEFKALDNGFEQDSMALKDYNGPLFQGMRLGNFSLTKEFADRVSVPSLPDFIEAVLPDTYKNINWPGAFPVIE